MRAENNRDRQRVIKKPVGAQKKYIVTFFALSIRVVTVEAIRKAIITYDCYILIAITTSLTAPDGVFTEWGLCVE